jgi:hypothetical protein
MNAGRTRADVDACASAGQRELCKQTGHRRLGSCPCDAVLVSLRVIQGIQGAPSPSCTLPSGKAYINEHQILGVSAVGTTRASLGACTSVPTSLGVPSACRECFQRCLYRRCGLSVETKRHCRTLWGAWNLSLSLRGAPQRMTRTEAAGAYSLRMAMMVWTLE